MHIEEKWKEHSLYQAGKIELIPTDWVWQYWGTDVSPAAEYLDKTPCTSWAANTERSRKTTRHCDGVTGWISWCYRANPFTPGSDCADPDTIHYCTEDPAGDQIAYGEQTSVFTL